MESIDSSKFSVYVEDGQPIILNKRDYLFAQGEKTKEIRLLIKGDEKRKTIDRIVVGLINSSYQTIVGPRSHYISAQDFGNLGKIIEYLELNGNEVERGIKHERPDYLPSKFFKASKYEVIKESIIKITGQENGQETEFLYDLITAQKCSGKFSSIGEFKIHSGINSQIKLAKASRKVSVFVGKEEYSTELTCYIYENGALASDVLDSTSQIEYDQWYDFNEIVNKAIINLLVKYNLDTQKKEYTGQAYQLSYNRY